MGYDATRFVQDSLEDFKCGICLDVLKEPVMVRSCEHIFCCECIVNWLKNDNTCPEDRAPLEETGLTEPTRFFRNQYSKLKVFCDFVKVSHLFYLVFCFKSIVCISLAVKSKCF